MSNRCKQIRNLTGNESNISLDEDWELFPVPSAPSWTIMLHLHKDTEIKSLNMITQGYCATK